MILASNSLAVNVLLVLTLVAIVLWTVYIQRPTGPKFKVGQTVTWLTTLQEGKVLQVIEDDKLYMVEFAADEIRVLHEERLCS